MQLEIMHKKLPENVCLIYTTICNKKYGIINDALNDKEKLLLEEACFYRYNNNRNNTIVCRNSKFNGERMDAFFEHLQHTKNLTKEFFFTDINKLQELRDEQFA